MKVLFNGLGSIGLRHLRLLRERDERFDVLAYRSGARSTETPDGVETFSSRDEALAEDPDVAFVTNPSNKHIETAIACGRAGCDLFIEKPLGTSLTNVDTLLEVVEQNDLVAHVGCQLRFHPVLQEINARLNEIGPVLSFRAYSGSYLPDWRPDRDYRESYSAKREMGGGAVLDLIHELDYTQWLVGPLHLACSHTTQASDLEIETEDIAEITVTADPDTVGQIHLDYVRRTPRRTVEIVGSHGSFRGDLIANRLTTEFPGNGGPEVETHDFEHERDDRFRDQLSYFFECVADRKSSDNDIATGKRVLELALEARQD